MTRAPASPHPLAARLSGASFVGHVALIVLSTIALTTFLAGPPPAWLQEPSAQTALRLGWRYSGPTYVVLGALAALLHAGSRFGVGRAVALLLCGGGIALGSELLGTHTGYPFGPYSYTPLLGYRILGLVPFPIPVSWFYMLYASLAICARVLPAADGGRARWRWALTAGLVLTAWDVAMDPAMVRTAHWVWHTPGVFYGMPFTNWIGWLLTGTVIARVMVAIVPPSSLAEQLAPARLPLALYAANGIMPVAICVRDGMWGAAVLGTLAMLVPLTLASGVRRWASGAPEVAKTTAAISRAMLGGEALAPNATRRTPNE